MKCPPRSGPQPQRNVQIRLGRPLRGPAGPTGPAGPASIVEYNPNGISAGQTQNFSTGGNLPALENDAAWNLPRAGTVTLLAIVVYVNTMSGSTTFTVRRSSCAGGVIGAFADTELAITVPAGTTGCFTDAGAVVVAVNDRLSLVGVAAAGSGAINFAASEAVA